MSNQLDYSLLKKVTALLTPVLITLLFPSLVGGLLPRKSQQFGAPDVIQRERNVNLEEEATVRDKRDHGACARFAISVTGAIN